MRAELRVNETMLARSGSSMHSLEEDEFMTAQEENPLEAASSSLTQPTPSGMERRDSLEHHVFTRLSYADEVEPPPPYEPFLSDAVDAPQITPIEYSCDNSPQLLTSPQSDIPEPPPRNRARLGSPQPPQLSPVQTPESPSSASRPSLVPAPLQLRPSSSSRSIPRRPLPSPTTQSATTFSSAKAREAGFEIDQPASPRRTDSGSSSFLSITGVSSMECLRHIREPGKFTAYLIPFPKPRLEGVKPEAIPVRFLVYTPPLPPLSKPAAGEKETHWHKTQRQWQEDVRKATMSNASLVTWKGMKAKSTSLIHKGVNMTRSTNVEFLDRASGGAVAPAAEDVVSQSDGNANMNIASSPVSTPAEASSEAQQEVRPPNHLPSSTSIDKDTKPKALEELTLIYPPSLNLTPEQIRTEFIDTLVRTREKSTKDALVASMLLPFAATIDASLIITFGGLTQVSGVWAYTSTRGAMTSKKITRKLERSNMQAEEAVIATEEEQEETEIRGCTCGHHEQDFGAPSVVPKNQCKDKAKTRKQKEKKGIHLHLQQNTHVEVLRRYLDLACLKRDFNMFPQINEAAAGDVNEESVLAAIGWRPVRRQGRDLEVEFKGRVDRLSPEEDELWQQREAREDVKRYLRKGAAEWIALCKTFQKDREAALKK